MTRHFLRILPIPILVLMAGTDLVSRLWVGEVPQTVTARDAEAALQQAQWRQPPEPERFDPFHDEVRSRALAAGGEDEPADSTEGSAEQYHYNYQLLATAYAPNGAMRALIRMEQRPDKGKGKPEIRIEVLQQGDSLGDARLLSVSSGHIMIESASLGRQAMNLFIPPELP